MKNIDTKNVKVLCLMIFGRSGSKFFQCIVDAHPQIISFPRNLQFDTFWKKVAGRRSDIEYVVDSFIKDYSRVFSGAIWYLFNKYDRADQLGPDRNETFAVDANIFRKNALERLKGKDVTRKELFVALHLAYHEACGKEIKDNSIIFCHIHSMKHVNELRACMEDFPNTFLLTRVRQPVERLKSCVTWMKMQNVFSCGQPYVEAIENMNGTEPIRKMFPGLDMRVLTFEELHWHHRECMQAFTRWMGIEWDEILMTPTIHGKVWWGDSNVLRYGSDPGWKLYQPKGFLEKNDWRVMLQLSGDRWKQYGYISSDHACEKIGRLKLFSILCIPTKVEWLVLKTMFSPRYWADAISAFTKDITSPERGDFDFYMKKQVAYQNKKIMGVKLMKPVIACRLVKQLMWHVWMLNPVKWSWFYVRRIVNFYGYAESHRTHKEVLPPLLYEDRRAHSC